MKNPIEKIKKSRFASEILKKDGTLKTQYVHLIEQRMPKENAKIYPNTWINHGRNLNSFYKPLYMLIEAMGYTFKEGNTAPRGGLEGDYIQISKTAFNAIKSLVDEY